MLLSSVLLNGVCDFGFVDVSFRQSFLGGHNVSQGSYCLDALRAKSACIGRPFLAQGGKEQFRNGSKQRFCAASGKCSGASRILRAQRELRDRRRRNRDPGEVERARHQTVRLIDLKNPRLLAFRGIGFYEINPELRVEAKFLPYHPPKKIKVATVSGYEEELECPGIAEFNLGGTAVQLEPVLETPGDTKLFFMFKDSTNGRETYGGGRYLYSDLPSHGHVLLNFNQAHNPYCAYNGFSTCQIPPLQNWLKVAISAGERKYPESK